MPLSHNNKVKNKGFSSAKPIVNSKTILLDMLKDIKEHQRDSSTLLEGYVQARLDKSLQTYYSELIESFNSLQRFDEVKKLRQFTKKSN